MLICQFCTRECKNSNSLRNHERLCKKNPDKQTTHFQTEEFQKWNKENATNQYTKADNLGLDRPIVSEETRKKLSIANKNRDPEIIKKASKKASDTICEKVKNGEWHTSLAKNMHYSYKGVDLHGSWELKYAMWLDKNRIEWIRTNDRFEYILDNSKRYYTPDFYLPDDNVYIEIKGYKTTKDEAKWSQFPKDKTLKVLFEKDLKDLDII